MKIVCDACQAKYSIADDKIQGKAFKIRCKKCNHIIVVRVGAEGGQAALVGGGAATEKPRATGSHTAAPAAARAPEQAVWHIVVDGEQVGPLTESEIKDRLRQGKANSDTLVWKEGFADWTQLSAVPELTPLLARITQHPVAKSAAREPQRPSAGRAAVGAPAAAAAAAAEEPDPFAAPTVVSAAGTADLFASAMAAPAAAPAASAAPAAASPFLFGGSAPAQAIEPVAARSSGGNGAGTTHLTGQRNENSVLFSLANLEALAVPAQSSNIRSPSASSNTEGSGLIDIRSMAAMTLGDGPSEPRRTGDVLPTFSTPQFSPVAPVILPMSTSGPPKWVYPVLAMLGIGIAALGIVIYTVANKPPPGLPPAPPPPPPPVAAPVAPAPAAPSAAPPSGEAAKPSEDKPSTNPAEEKTPEKGKSGGGKGDKVRRKGDQTVAKGGSEGKKGSEGASGGPSGPTESAAPKPAGKKGAKSLDDLLGEVGSKKGASGGGEEAPKPAVKLITLSQSDIVTAMKAVQPKIQLCANQFKTPGTAMANINVASGGRVASATVTGKFVGTPTGTCVEQAAKSAKFPPCQPMNFPWPFTLLPR